MATELEKALNQYKKRTTGAVNSWKVRTLSHGAKVIEEMDNFILGELGFDENGERTVKPLSDVANKGYLVATVERRYMGEPIDAFYNAVGDRARVIYLDEGLRFETSAFEGTDVANGRFAHFNPATKKFILHDGSHADYAGAVDKFVVVNHEDDLEYTQESAQIRLEVL